MHAELSGRDSIRVLFIPPTHPPGNPGDGHPELDERPAINARALPGVVKAFEELGYTFVRAERRPDGCEDWEAVADPTHKGTAPPSPGKEKER